MTKNKNMPKDLFFCACGAIANMEHDGKPICHDCYNLTPLSSFALNDDEVINLTPHPIILKIGDASIVIKQSGIVTRISTTSSIVTRIFGVPGVPLVRTSFGKIEGMPVLKKDVYYIVSTMVKAAFPDNDFLIVPHDLIRNDDGYITGCKSFSL